uniref:Uncharacterized protein n=1 Tax=Quercus lobata TaxID=97700 RepID=A0A7N2QYM1_QUELO
MVRKSRVVCGYPSSFRDWKSRIIISNPIHTPLPFSPTMSIEEFPSPPRTWKGKKKKCESVWTDPVTALGWMHNIISEDELKALSLVPSHEPVSRHIHKLVQVLGESLRMMTDYLTTEEKLVMANSWAEATKAESSKLRKDLIEAMGEANDAKTNLKEVSDELRIEKMLVIQKE